MQPSVGSTISVLVKRFTPISRILFPNEPFTTEYNGTVIKSASYDDSNTFRLTGDVNTPIRVIYMKNVLAVDGMKNDFVEVKDKIVIVKGSKGNEYVVTIGATGRNTCTCSGYGFRKNCSHIQTILNS